LKNGILKPVILKRRKDKEKEKCRLKDEKWVPMFFVYMLV